MSTSASASASASAPTSRLIPASIAAASQRKRRRSSATRNGNGNGVSWTSSSRPREAAAPFGTSWEQEEHGVTEADPFDALISRRLSASSHASSDSDGKGKGKARAVEQEDHDGEEATVDTDTKENGVLSLSLPLPPPTTESHAREEEEDIIEEIYDDDEDESLHCAICLGVIDDRTVVQPCSHDAYCFRCILAWTDQSRKCPLCNTAIELLLHHIRSERDFQRHYLAPLIEKSDASAYASASQRTASQMLAEGARSQLLNRPTHPRFKFADWKLRNRPAAIPEMDAEDLALEKRRYVYRHGLFVKHVGANRYTRVGPLRPCFPQTPAKLSAHSTETSPSPRSARPLTSKPG